jgi:hypothetical protein
MPEDAAKEKFLPLGAAAKIFATVRHARTAF